MEMTLKELIEQFTELIVDKNTNINEDSFVHCFSFPLLHEDGEEIISAINNEKNNIIIYF